MVPGRRKEEGGGRRESTRRGWVAPTEGYVKINVDAVVQEGVGVNLGMVCRDGRGRVLWGATHVLEQLWESHIAEAVAVLEGIKEARWRGHENIVVESDCLQVIEALRKSRSGRSIFDLVLDDISSLRFSFNSVVWSFTSRLNNGVAHALAHPFPRVVGKEYK
ncbi:uncharacterized protein LOC141608414 [Silene latifolia]|uniref:uncharacterized protein LOC141608414 n=1 Tax=Silene latifolia TaxID=37657 RepID=UPI003D783EB9